MPDLLFSAPYEFLPSLDSLGWSGTALQREVWEREDLPEDQGFTVWMPNPGQHFIIDGDVMDRYPKLRAIATPSTGTNHIDKDAAAERGISVACLLDDRTTLDTIAASAEFTFLTVLNALRRIDVGYAAVSGGEWRDDEARFRGNELEGRRVALIGYGRIGKRLGRYFHAFDCSIEAYDPYVDDFGPVVKRQTSLDSIFADNDVVVTCCVLNDESQGMITDSHVRQMRDGAVLVNTSRGEVWDEQAIFGLAREERSDLTIAVDVVHGEVTGRHLEGPAVRMHREGLALVTPHIAGATVESQAKAARGAIRLAHRLLEGSN